MQKTVTNSPLVYLQTHLAQFTALILMTSKLEMENDNESAKNDKITQEARAHLEKALKVLQEMKTIHGLQQRQQRI